MASTNTFKGYTNDLQILTALKRKIVICVFLTIRNFELLKKTSLRRFSYLHRFFNRSNNFLYTCIRESKTIKEISASIQFELCLKLNISKN